MTLYSMFTQNFPERPQLTEANLPSQNGKVCLVTGANPGIGFELCKILYGAGATVHFTTRTLEKAEQCLLDIEEACGDGDGRGVLEYTVLELSDLAAVKVAAEDVVKRQTRLDVVWLNAGLASNAIGGQTKDGIEIHVGTNCVGSYFFAYSSFLVDAVAARGGFEIKDLDSPSSTSTINYTNSKTGNWFLASEFGRRCSDGHIISITINPGSVKTGASRYQPMYIKLAVQPWLHPAKGAYTTLWAGMSDEVTIENNGRYAIPWGRWHPGQRQDLLDALKSRPEGGTGRAAEFWEWCEMKTAEIGPS